jgi:protein SCO1/2
VNLLQATKALPRWIPVALASAIAIVVLAALALWRLSSPSALPVLATAPAFSLTDQEGRTVSSDQLRGKVAIVGFIYTNCPDICPMLTNQMRGLQLKLKDAGLLGTEAQLMSITVDPERDTPAVLAQYAKEHGAETGTWRFLTGEPEAIRQTIVKGFLLPVEKEMAAADSHNHGSTGAATSAPDPQQTYIVNHSGKIALVDKTGQIRAYYDSESLDAAKVIAAIKALQ